MTEEDPFVSVGAGVKNGESMVCITVNGHTIAITPNLARVLSDMLTAMGNLQSGKDSDG